MKMRSSSSAAFACAVIIGIALGTRYSGSGPTPEVIPNTRAAEAQSQEELDGLLKQRYDTAKALLDLEEKRLREGVTTLAHVCEAARWVRDSALELPVSAQERLAALTAYVDLTRRLEVNVDRATARGAAPPSDLQSARYLRLDAEIMLLRVNLQSGNRSGKLP